MSGDPDDAFAGAAPPPPIQSSTTTRVQSPPSAGGKAQNFKDLARQQMTAAREQGSNIARQTTDRAREDAALAKERGTQLAGEGMVAAQQNAEAMRGMASDVQRFKGADFRDPRVQMQAAGSLLAARNKGQALYAQNKAMVDQTKEAMQSAKAEVQNAAQEAKQQAYAAGAQQLHMAKDQAVGYARNAAAHLEDEGEVGPGDIEPVGVPPPGGAPTGMYMGTTPPEHVSQPSMLQRGAEAAMAARREAQRAAQEMHAQTQVLGQQAMQKASQVASVAVDIARAEYDQRWNKAMEQERKLKESTVELEKREKQLALLLSKNEPNWPRKCCCISPLVHHDIIGDIPIARQSFVRKLYINYYVTIFLLVANFAVALTMIIIKNKEGKDTESDMMQHMGVSILLLTGAIFAFMLWYWPSYKACGTGSSGQFVMGFVGLIIALFFDVLMTIGPVGYGGCGFLYSMRVKDTKPSDAFIPCIILSVLWIIQGVFFLWTLFRLRKYWNEDKASLSKARAELVAGEIRSAL